MFTRLHDRGKYNGSGLGLAISKKVIDHFDGEVTIESEIENGSTFIITLPVQDSCYKPEKQGRMRTPKEIEKSVV